KRIPPRLRVSVVGIAFSTLKIGEKLKRYLGWETGIENAPSVRGKRRELGHCDPDRCCLQSRSWTSTAGRRRDRCVTDYFPFVSRGTGGFALSRSCEDDASRKTSEVKPRWASKSNCSSG